MLVVALVADEVADVVEQRGGVEQDAVARAEAVAGGEVVEEADGEAGHQGAVGLVEVVAAAEAEAGVVEGGGLGGEVLRDEVAAGEVDEDALLEAHARRGDPASRPKARAMRVRMVAAGTMVSARSGRRA